MSQQLRDLYKSLMKRSKLFLLLFLLILPMLVFDISARQLVVRDFKSQPLDQTANNRETLKVDPKNGKTAALVKINTPLLLQDLEFSGSALGIVATEQRTGQIWLYIPARSQRITVNHREHGSLDLIYPVEIVSGRTYSMVLTFEGKDVSLVASAPGAELVVDGEDAGTSPQTMYLAYGVHSVKATKGTLLYEGTINVTKDGPDLFELQLEDEDLKYADVLVTVPDNAEIWYEGKMVGIGSWLSHLREGQYVVETRKEDHESRTTTFRVSPGGRQNVSAHAPEPYKGWLRLNVHPDNGVSIMAGDTIFTDNSSMQLNVGNYDLTFKKRGYNPLTRRFTITRNEELFDTIVLKKKQFIKKNTVYAGAGFTWGTIPGISFFLGGSFYNVSLEGSYMVGLGRTKNVSWFSNVNDLFDETVNYSMSCFSVKLGYQLRFIERIGLTPQVGYQCQMLKAHAVEGVDGETGPGIRGNGAKCGNLLVGARFCFSPIQHFSIFVIPEYAIPMMKSETYDKIAPVAGITKGGLYITAGLAVNL